MGDLKLEYVGTLDEYTESYFRMQRRSKSVQMFNRAVMIVVPLMIGLLVFKMESVGNEAFAALKALMIALIIWFGFAIVVKLKLQPLMRHIAKNAYGDSIHNTIQYVVTDTQLQCALGSMTLSFQKDSITDITVDERFLEIGIGNKAICVIPLRVFATHDDMEAFVAKVNIGRTIWDKRDKYI